MVNRNQPSTAESTDRRTFLKASGAMGAAGLAGLAGCLDGFDDTPEDRDVFRFGAVTSLSGDLRFGGTITERGYDLWEQAVNENGGIEIDGTSYEVEVEYADAQSEPSTGADAAEQMIDSGVDALFGPYSSNVTLAVAPIAEREGLPHITGSAESPDIWKEQYRYTFGTIPAGNVIAGDAAESIFNFDPAPETVCITGVNDPFTSDVAEALRETAEANGIEVLYYELFPRDADWTSPVSVAKNEDPDLHFHAAHIEAHVDFLTAAKDLDYNPDAFFSHYGVDTESFAEGLGDDAAHTLGATVWLPRLDLPGDILFDGPQDYADASEAAFDVTPDYTQAGSTAAGIVYQEALQELGAAPPLLDDEKDELIDILENIEVQTFYGEVDFETEGDLYHSNTAADILTIQRSTDGFDIVAPDTQMESEPEYPVPEWGAR
ncbi:ABC-type transport system periplasmic substrate-binding protein (probable substrate branched-chain amino acids) (plasmid) [Natronomonas pharaonis DSM 2160]|uniref:ABC-type transport system periplasmic substrate-binding protein (Probable substrate branched-chain amino acids) n=1 Tax=Natronomonas pharaonis (strain ATCC 35678 / DSM 2160 / CIP 103997 / JCM 8858 / NBRC 14720 / NCIMB 2260 / Gabara) TaxID=348780 RepID=Q3ILZ4_NATPD|nr:amino acid ABC transporter substrate-binding protein [Natronomonas pharaonis]CAI50875.2 ABC-type transport system periplasmic substrate-binding protein (probable substrate branched-chain amino acids) [Natronomonas pharaonis DSM 2160]